MNFVPFSERALEMVVELYREACSHQTVIKAHVLQNILKVSPPGIRPWLASCRLLSLSLSLFLSLSCSSVVESVCACPFPSFFLSVCVCACIGPGPRSDLVVRFYQLLWELINEIAYRIDIMRSRMTESESGSGPLSVCVCVSRPQTSQLAEPLWTDLGVKSGIGVHEMIST